MDATAVGIISIIGVIVAGWMLMRKSPIWGLALLGIGAIAGVAAIGGTELVASIPPAIGNGVATAISSVG